MKNLDIENLERKNIFKTPESFFEDMQAKVLQQVSIGNELDVENLERKNIFKTPEGFFENMQAKVLQEIEPVQTKKEGRVVKMNWVYAAAAAITMFFGITFFVSNDTENKEVYIADNVISNTSNNEVIVSKSVNKPKTEARVALKTLEADLTSVTPTHHKTSTKPMTIATTNIGKSVVSKNASQQNPEAQMDQVLATFTSAELADLGKNSEQDIYLDLYN